VEKGINALKAVWHRGAVDADGKTGDGAGIHVQIPVPSSTTRCCAPGMSRARTS
jgi:glutamate synthase domain-containing protein 1